MAGNPKKEPNGSCVVAALRDEGVNGQPSHEAKSLDLAGDSVVDLSSEEESERYQIPRWFLTHNVKPADKVLGCRSKIDLIARPTNNAPSLESFADPRMSSKPITLDSKTSNTRKSSDLRTPNEQRTSTGPKSSKVCKTLNGSDIFKVRKLSSVCETLKTPEMETGSASSDDDKTSTQFEASDRFETSSKYKNLNMTEERCEDDGDTDVHTYKLFDKDYSRLRDVTKAALYTDHISKRYHSTQTSILLQVPLCTDIDFVESVLDQLARELQANLISLDLQDLTDLVVDFKCQDRDNREENDDYDDDDDDDDDDADEYRCEEMRVLNFSKHYLTEGYFKKCNEELNFDAISAIILAPAGQPKDRPPPSQSTSWVVRQDRAKRSSPTFLHIRNAKEIMALGGEHCILRNFRAYVKRRRKMLESVILFVSVFSDTFTSDEKKTTMTMFQVRLSAVIEMTPPRFDSFTTDNADNAPCPRERNVRVLKRALRYNFRYEFSANLLNPYASWDPATLGPISSVLEAPSCNEVMIDQMVTRIIGRTSDKLALELEDICSVIGDLVEDMHLEEKKEPSVEDKSPTKVDMASNMKGRLKKLEKEFLSCVIPADAIDIRMDDVIVDQQVKETVEQLISLSIIRSEDIAPGLFQQIRIPGMILYGPPGTGKTHLTRAIAKKAGVAILSVTAAEIESKFVGDTEKNIKAVFSLAAKLTPSIIFIDEADSLFYKRSSGDRSYERKATNQFLQAMDGLVTNKDSPFIIIATNRPMDLDEAFLRRLPQKIFLPLPSEADRIRILKTFLKDGHLSPGVSVGGLARATEGFSGSDLQTLCVQASQVFAMELQSQQNSSKIEKEALGGPLARPLSPGNLSPTFSTVGTLSVSSRPALQERHFRKALERTTPSVSKSLLRELDKFSQQFSPRTVKAPLLGTDTILPHFTYSPLRSPDETFRLLVILPDPPDAMLRIGISPLPLDYEEFRRRRGHRGDPFRHMNYCALSYAWGDTTLLSEIEIRLPPVDEKYTYEKMSAAEGDEENAHVAPNATWLERAYPRRRRFEIGSNLEAALRNLRRGHSEGGFLVWADGICIDQNNPVEKGYQVRNMGKVYRNAYYVSIWLGNEGEESNLAMDLLEKFEKAWPTFRAADGQTSGQGYRQFRQDNEHLTQHWIALEKLMKRPWFQRRWIIQETVLSRRKEVSCGEKSASWYALYHASLFLDNNDIEEPCHLLRSLHDTSHFQERGELEHLTLERLCQDFHHSVCKDPRDIIYSLFALATDVDTKDQPWFPDYSPNSTAMDLFLRVFEHFIHQSQSLDIMLCSNHFRPDISETWLPCFGSGARECCADMSESSHGWRHPKLITFGGSFERGCTKSYSASTSTPPEIKIEEPSISTGESRYSLTTKGYRVDTISKVGQEVGALLSGKDSIDIPEEWVRIALGKEGPANSELPSPSLTSEDWERLPGKFWRSLVGNRAFTTTLVKDEIVTLEKMPSAWPEIIRKRSSHQIQHSWSSEEDKEWNRISESITVVSRCASFIRTESSMGFTSRFAEKDDIICTLLGCSVPVILRPCMDRPEFYHFVGECYIDGIMDGEAFQEYKSRGTEPEEFRLH